MTTFDITAALRARFKEPEYAFFTEVRNGTGFSRRTIRTADGLAMSLWPGRGLELIGIEVKVSRGDWLREKKDPAKAEEIQAYCDRWYLAVSDPKIVQPGELPPTWGLLVPKGGGLVAAVDAPKLEAKPLDRLLLAAILRRACATIGVPKHEVEAEVQRRIEATLDAERKRTADSSERALEQSRADLASLRDNIATFERASGVRIDRWSGGNVGAAFAAFQRLQRNADAIDRLGGAVGEAGTVLDELRTLLGSVRGAA